MNTWILPAALALVTSTVAVEAQTAPDLLNPKFGSGVEAAPVVPSSRPFINAALRATLPAPGSFDATDGLAGMQFAKRFVPSTVLDCRRCNSGWFTLLDPVDPAIIPSSDGATLMPLRPDALAVPGRVAASDAATSGSEPSYHSAFSLGAFVPTGVPSGYNASVGFTLAYGGVLKSFGQNDLTAGIRFSYYSFAANDGSVSGNEDVFLLHTMVGYRFNLANRKFYIEPSVGFADVIQSATAGGGDVSVSAVAEGFGFAYGIAAGANFSRYFAEIQYLGGSTAPSAGLTASLGIRF